MRDAWPEAEVAVDPELVARLSLPDPDDRHVLAAAIAGGAEVLMTLNRADFPTRTLARHGILLREPDGFLTELAGEGVDLVAVAAGVQARAERASGRPQPIRALLRRTGLPRLGKALEAELAAGRAGGLSRETWGKHRCHPTTAFSAGAMRRPSG